MNLTDYPTPMTDEKFIHAGMGKSHLADFARDLERRLALCRDVMKRQAAKPWTHAQEINEALAATEPKL